MDYGNSSKKLNKHMKILGINFGHDASVSINDNGKLLCCIEEEKVSRIKQDFGWPKNAIKRLFSEYKIKKSEIDVVALMK